MRKLHAVVVAAATGMWITSCAGAGDTSVGSPTSVTSTQEDTEVISTTPTSPVESSVSSDPVQEPATADTEAELRTAVTTYSDAFLGGDPGEAYGMFSQRCQEAVSLSYFTGIVGAAAATYGAALPIRSFEANLSDSIALVTYTYDLPALDQASEPLGARGWRLEAGRVRVINGCC